MCPNKPPVLAGPRPRSPDRMPTEPTNLYFAYASNMCPAQMRRRCPDAIEIGQGTLEAHRLVFNRRGTYRPGGVASIIPTHRPIDTVPGVVWQLSPTDLATLDRIEDPTAYRRTTCTIFATPTNTWHCFAYTAIPQADHIPPDPDYLQILIEQSKQRGFAPTYVQYLEAMA